MRVYYCLTMDFMVIMIAKVLYAWVGKDHHGFRLAYKKDLRRRLGWPDKCEICWRRVKSHGRNGSATLTIDHIIPKSVLEELELYELLYEDANFMIMCQACNGRKANTMPNIQTLSPELLGKFYNALDRRNKELALTQSL